MKKNKYYIKESYGEYYRFLICDSINDYVIAKCNSITDAKKISSSLNSKKEKTQIQQDIMYGLKEKIIKFQDICYKSYKSEKDICIKDDAKKIRYIVYIDGKEAIVLTTLELDKLKSAKGKYPFWRCYFYFPDNPDKEVWEYFREKELNKEGVVNSLLSYTFLKEDDAHNQYLL